MLITFENNAIVFNLQNDSLHLKPLMLFAEKSFKSIKHFSNMSVILYESGEEIKKKYLLNWAFKIHKKAFPLTSPTFLNQLIASHEMPIHIITSNNTQVAQQTRVTIEKINTLEILVSFSHYHEKIFKYFQFIFKDAIRLSPKKTSFTLKITTKAAFLLLKNILSNKKIVSIPIHFITYGLSFKRSYQEDTALAEHMYEEKLKKSYKLLNICDTSTPSQMKKNYLYMLKKYHPDTVYHQNNEVIKLYTNRFQVIQNAYDFVKEHRRSLEL